MISKSNKFIKNFFVFDLLNLIDKRKLMNRVEIGNHSVNCLQTAKNMGIFVGTAAAIAVFAVAHPIIGPLGSLGSLCSAAYHGVLLNYHWRHSREKDENGNLIPGTELNHQGAKSEKNYTNPNAKFNGDDLARLQNEVQRLYHLKAAGESLKWARGLAKCTIPIIGLVWAVFSEINAGGSIAMECEGCNSHWDHLTPEEMLKMHINKLTLKNKDKIS